MKTLENMKVGMRVGLGFAALLAIQLLIAGIGLRQMSQLADHVDLITEVGEAKSRTLIEVSANINGRAFAARNLVLLSGPAAQKPDLDRVKSAQVGIDKGMEKLAALTKDSASSTAEERKMLDQLRSLEASYLPIATKIVALATTQKTEDAVRALTQECMPLLSQVIAHVGAFDDLLNRESVASAAAATGV